MTANPTLKLVEADPEFDDVIPMERRLDPRFVINGHVTAVRNSDLAGRKLSKICSLQLVNMSDSGLGAICQEPIEPGSSLTVFFPPHGPEQGFDAYGEVLRCRPRDGHGHELGVRFYTRAAA